MGIRTAMLAFAGAAVAAAVFVPSAHAAGGNADAAKACQQGGYAGLERTDGSTFGNAGACVSYAAGGGRLQAKGTDAASTTTTTAPTYEETPGEGDDGGEEGDA
jgi:hypothetical protein